MTKGELSRQRRQRLAGPRIEYGSTGPTVMTHAEVGAILGISRQAVQQIERSALWKLRQSHAIKELHDERFGKRLDARVKRGDT